MNYREGWKNLTPFVYRREDRDWDRLAIFNMLNCIIKKVMINCFLHLQGIMEKQISLTCKSVVRNTFRLPGSKALEQITQGSCKIYPDWIFFRKCFQKSIWQKWLRYTHLISYLGDRLIHALLRSCQDLCFHGFYIFEDRSNGIWK